MNDNTKIIDILQVAIPADTALTVSSEIKILELLGIVKTPQLVSAMQLVSNLIPASTPATVNGLIQLLAGLVKISPKAAPAHQQSISLILSQLDAVPDTNRTFGTLLTVCQSLAAGGSSAEHHKKA